MKFVLSGNLLRFSNFQREIEVAAHTVADAITTLVGDVPGLAPVLLDATGQLRKVHRLFLNHDQLCAAELARRVGPDDEVMILTAIAGG
jgi:molybdopterin synthase sulfur carrier subunit